MEIQNLKFRNEPLKDAAQLAIKNGLKVYTKKDSAGLISWLYVTDEKNISSVSAERWGVTVSTIHKPNRTTGTGYSLHGYNNPKEFLTIEEIKAGFIFCPNWAKTGDRASVKKYKSFDEFKKTKADVFKIK